MESMRTGIVENKSKNRILKKKLDKIKIGSKNNQMKNINNEFEKKIKNNLLEIDGINKEMIVIKNENRLLINKFNNIDESRFNEVIEKIQSKSQQQTREIDEMKENCEQTNNKENHTGEIIDEIFDNNADLNKQSNIDYDERINNLQIKSIKMERVTENFGEFEWKIENFSQQRQSKYIYSDSFYSHKYGYKMCLGLTIIDNNVGVDFYLMRGEYDNDLLWPFNYDVTIDIINQMSGEVHTNQTIKYDEYRNLQGWNKPTTERNNPIYFLPIKQSKQIIQNNQMIVKCKIKI